MQSLAGKTAVVTGGASGMGRAMALRFAEAGMNVVIGDLAEAGMAETVEAATAKGVDARAVVTDVASEEANVALRDAAIDAFGQCNVVCLNAGVTGAAGRSWTLSADDWDWCRGILLDGVAHGIRAFVPGLVDHDDGHVVITASIAGHVGGSYSGPYIVAKHGVAALAETLYHELKAEGSSVGVTCLCPGFVSTDIVEATKRQSADAPGAPKDEAGERWLAYSGRALASGLDPSIVGDQVHDAVLADQFWLFTDEAWDSAIAERVDRIVNRRPPVLGRPTG
ncbi:MAG: SDR family NAD(P)-dependent oxidoreductase [Acidimicrobiales bacterium]